MPYEEGEGGRNGQSTKQALEILFQATCKQLPKIISAIEQFSKVKPFPASEHNKSSAAPANQGS